MKCGNCHYGEHYLLVSNDPKEDKIELVQCPFGDQVFRFPDKRCSHFLKRKEAEARDGYC